jgi:hypothetical protein
MTFQPAYYRIASLRTQNRILHVEDALELGKIRWDAYTYSRGNGAQVNAHAFTDADDARVLAAILTGTVPAPPDLTFRGGSKTGDQPTARILRLEPATDANAPWRLRISNGPGVVQALGLISPQQGAKMHTVAVLLTAYHAARLGLALSEHLQAWASNAYTDHISQVWRPDPALGPESAPASPGSPPTPAPNDAPPTYADGTELGTNPAERDAFLDYAATHGGVVPPDRLTLRQWYADQRKESNNG